ncbi:N-acetylmuramoyl-L-alanine amidase [Terriglobus saanensis]|uniref:N-acetylmuramoyl-L-alanine amidase n=1 Tax=Terriglobus saanensis (strain ATCC BAA-1853 / DSM 23119 / SP1PR4) TaxID=401053 RepID=E8V2T4_TERSS|nr:N-acetylmuramoyl-L-alanine amidase [Terriglobus saanensis]ADV84631.1 cell wall hydrolase/autolysin [Terriglobus saanensis SP1PR4]
MTARRTSRSSRIAVAVCVGSAFLFAHGATKRKALEQTPWELAESARATLLQEPAETRTRNDYTVVMDAYRAIYHDSPGALKAPDAIFTVASLLADEGRVLHDQKALRNAIGQYEFLRTQYPTSSLRISALFAEGQIAQNDLSDTKLAKEKYSLYIEKYPRASQVADAQTALADIRAGRKSTPVVTTPIPENADAASAPLPPPVATPVVIPGSSAASAAAAPTAVPVPGPQHTAPRKPGRLASVTGIRHWSTPTYTRVVIDLGDDIEYEAARVPHPDRIYFDLHGTRLAQELTGKSFTVTDDGFLKKIRIAQFSNDMTRVVLDVNDVTEYSAFLLPNPYRLIIDIHGKQKIPTTGDPAPAPAPTATVVNPDLPVFRAPASAKPYLEKLPTDGVHTVPPPARSTQLPSFSTTERSAAPVANVPSTTVTHALSSHDVAALSQQPDRQTATTQPTSRPIAQVVSPLQPDVDAASTSGVATRKGRRKAATKDSDSDVPADHAAMPTADGQRSLVRALGLKIGRIVIDAGHGGHDSGTLGAGGIMEKDVVLDVALRLGKMLHDHLGAEIIYTRSDDTFIPLETRTAIANKAQADLFISVHANSSSDETARGVETYYLNFTSSPDALDVAARENAVSDQSIHQLADLVKKITLKDKIDESREFASDVEDSLYKGLQQGNAGLKNRGVKKAPFVVLIGANMPSILAEISFVTNPRDAAQLRQPEYRQRVAESLYKGVARYAGGLSGMRVAARGAGSESGGQ